MEHKTAISAEIGLFLIQIIATLETKLDCGTATPHINGSKKFISFMQHKAQPLLLAHLPVHQMPLHPSMT